MFMVVKGSQQRIIRILNNPKLFSRDRTKQALAFELVGTNYAGPFYCNSKGKNNLKAYIILCSHSFSRAVHQIISECQIIVLPNLSKVSRD